jgi:glyoxylase-like metal-dependent hydrolase (beta-lactamase superfamily II)
MTASPAQVYAIRYARREALSRDHFYGLDPHDGSPMPMDYFIWAIVGDYRPIIVDAGFTPETAARRNRTLMNDPIEVLAGLGVQAADVEHVILTHLHFDHSGHLGSFPNATFWLQEKEMAFWTGRYASRRDIGRNAEPGDIAELVRLNYDHRVRFVDGDEAVNDYVHVWYVGGHTPGMQVVSAETPGGRVVLASDAAHYYETIEEDRPYSVLHCVPEMYRAYDRIMEIAGPTACVIPGHDPLVFDRYPAVNAELDGKAVEISVK